MKSGVKRCHSQHPLKIKLYTQVSNKGLDVIICNPQSQREHHFLRLSQTSSLAEEDIKLFSQRLGDISQSWWSSTVNFPTHSFSVSHLPRIEECLLSDPFPNF